MKKSLALLALLAASFTASAAEPTPLDLAKKNNCLTCHAADTKVVGPAYKDVAAKYKGKSAEELAKSIKAGGAGKWGPIPMPAQTQLSDADAKTLAAWVLKGAPSK